jgi:hypothetical protein
MLDLSTSTDSQHLPLEIVLLILEHAIQQDSCRLIALASISKSIRLALLSRFTQEFHIYNKEGYDRFVDQTRSHHFASPLSIFPFSKNSGNKAALYIHHFFTKVEIDNRSASMVGHWKNLSATWQRVPEHFRLSVETLALCGTSCKTELVSSCLWTTSLYPNLKHLYVDSTTHVDYGDAPAVDRLTLGQFCIKPNQLETYALAENSHTFYGPSASTPAFGKFIKDTFPNIKRVFLFHFTRACYAHYYNIEPAHRIFHEVTDVKVVVNIGVFPDVPNSEWTDSWRSIEPDISETANGTMVMNTVIVKDRNRYSK